MTKKILIVLTSHDILGETGQPTGFWLEELAAPYYVFKDAGYDLTLASPKGGQPPLDPKSDDPASATAATDRFKQDAAAQAELASTVTLADVNSADFDAVFYPGGHGPLWDLVDDADSLRLIGEFWAQNKPVSAVCHAPIVFKHAKDAQGDYIVKGREVTGFTNSEEEAVGLTAIVPHLVEDVLIDRGGKFSKAGDWQANVRRDGNLVTGQNPASSEGVAEAVIGLLK